MASKKLYIPRHAFCDTLTPAPILYATDSRLLALLQLRNMNAAQVAVMGDPTSHVRVLGHFPGAIEEAFWGVSGYLYHADASDFVCGSHLRAFRVKPYEFVRVDPEPIVPASFERIDNIYDELAKIPTVEFLEAEHAVTHDKDESDRIRDVIAKLERVYAGILPSRPLLTPSSKLFK